MASSTEHALVYTEAAASLCTAGAYLQRADKMLSRLAPGSRERQDLEVQVRQLHRWLDRIEVRMSVTDWDAELAALSDNS